MRRLGRWVMLVAVIVAAGCNDPASQHRIRMREERLAAFGEKIERMEQHRSERLHEVAPTVRKWWREDCDLYQRRMPTIGDYVW